MIRLLIADDHLFIREGLKRLFESENGLSVVAEASNSHEVYKVLSDVELDLILLDISMPGRSGLDVLKEIKKYHPRIPVLILTMHPEERYAIRAFRAGAAGYLTKKCSGNELLSAIHKIHNGGKHISQNLAEKLADEVEFCRNKEYHELLSDREYQIMRKIAKGETIQCISKDLSLSISTVNTYRYRILEKMNMTNNLEIIRYALEYKLID